MVNTYPADKSLSDG